MKKYFRNNWVPVLMLLVSGVGFFLFYLLPFLYSLRYVVMENPLTQKFVGLNNFITLFHYPYFLTGLKNTVRFMSAAIPLNMIMPLVIAVVLGCFKRHRKIISLLFLIPLVIPSATTAFFWEIMFSQYGFVNKILWKFGMTGPVWFQSEWAMVPVIVIFLWKNIGYNMALYISGLSNIPESYHECAALEGAGRFWRFFHITLVYLTPTFFLVLIMSIVNSFKVFKEIYIITGQYPPEELYMLQHYMNNMFLSLQYPKLATAIYILTVIIVFLLAGLFRAEKVSANRIGV